MENISRIGVTAVQSVVYNKLQWIFREQLVDDFGIDALIEVAGKEYPTGKLIAVQIKSGSSYFTETNKNDVIFRFDKKHQKYWFEHSCPVILILYHPKNKNCIWEAIDKITVKHVSEGAYKIAIPFNNYFDASAKEKLLILAYSKNIGELANNIDSFDVDTQSLITLLDDDQKIIFLKARREFNKKNASAVYVPLDDIDEISRLVDSIEKVNREENNYEIHNLWNDAYVGNSQGFERIERFIGRDDSKIMIILGSAGIGKSTLVRMFTELHREKNDISFIWAPSIYPDISLTSILQKTYQKHTEIKAIIIDGWDERPVQQNDFFAWQEVLEWQKNHEKVKIIITSRTFNAPINEKCETFEMRPFSQSEALYFLQAISGENFVVEDMISRILSIFNTPLLLQMLVKTSRKCGIPVEEVTAEAFLFSLIKKYSDNQIMMLEELAFKMMRMNSTSIKVENDDELWALSGCKEICVNNGQISFVHAILYEFFVAKYIFRRIFQELESPELFEKKVWNILAHNACSIEVLNCLKLIIKHDKIVDGSYAKQLTYNLQHMLEQGKTPNDIIGIDVFTAVSNVFYAMWHMISHMNRIYFGSFQPQLSEKGGVNLACLINIFNKIYFNKMYLDFSYINISGIKLWRCNLININFKRAKLCHVNFLGSCLAGSNLEQADLSYCNLVNADLRNANIRNAVLTGANVSHCMIAEDSLRYVLPYKDTMRHIEKLIIFMNDGSIARFSEFF